MGSPITFSGFNQIDFNVVLNSIMQQENLPLQVLQQQQQALQSTDSAFSALATRLGALQTAAEGLSNSSTVTKYAVTSSDATAVSVSDGGASVAGHYSIVVNELAQAQVTASSTTAADTDTTIVATGGTLTIGGIAVAITGGVTLSGLKDLINGTSGVPATASVVETAPGAFRLVLTGTDTGSAHAFAIVNALSGGSGVGFASGNALEATNASILVNNLVITSASNTLEAGIPGVTLNLFKKDSSKTIAVDVSRDDGSLKDRVKAFISAYNDLATFADQQARTGMLGRETVFRSLRSSLRSALTSAYGSGTYTGLAEVGIGFTRTGQLSLDETALTAAIANDQTAVTQLFTGTSGTGAFASIDNLISEYTQTDGFVGSARTRITDELTRLDNRIADMQDRLAQRRLALQREFTAADEIISRLNSQSGALSSLGGQLTTNTV
jgi:flagellar hook-associated protein 2